MKILIISDTHGQDEDLERILEEVGPIDALIHCGDVEGQEERIKEQCKCPVYIVAGNNDYFSTLDREMEFELAGHRIFLTHGHHYGVSINTENIKEEGESRNADIVMFGHTHRPYLDQGDGIILLNPGSLAYPRQVGHEPSFILMEIDEDGQIDCTMHYIEASGMIVQE